MSSIFLQNEDKKKETIKKIEIYLIIKMLIYNFLIWIGNLTVKT